MADNVWQNCIKLHVQWTGAKFITLSMQRILAQLLESLLKSATKLPSLKQQTENYALGV